MYAMCQDAQSETIAGMMQAACICRAENGDLDALGSVSDIFLQLPLLLLQLPLLLLQLCLVCLQARHMG